jgi:hypothetical protein
MTGSIGIADAHHTGTVFRTDIVVASVSDISLKSHMGEDQRYVPILGYSDASSPRGSVSLNVINPSSMWGAIDIELSGVFPIGAVE